jgi:hypothetical protein
MSELFCQSRTGLKEPVLVRSFYEKIAQHRLFHGGAARKCMPGVISRRPRVNTRSLGGMLWARTHSTF